MKLATTLFAAAASTLAVHSAVAQSHIRCQNTIGGPCGDSSRPREMNCCDYGYCQPWNAGYYQCLERPTMCQHQETDIDFYGNDLKAVRGIQPSDCCTECTRTPGCLAYTFVNENPDGTPVCYLKSSSDGRIEKKGAVSGMLLHIDPPPSPPPSPSPPVECTTETGATCGNAQQTTCCRSGSYCQPWNAWYYQCIATPPFCSTLYTDMDYFGNDIQTLYGILPSDCCAVCARTANCRAFTFVNENPDGRAACYLKSTASGPLVPKKGALASVLIYDPIPTPTPPPVAQAPSTR